VGHLLLKREFFVFFVYYNASKSSSIAKISLSPITNHLVNFGCGSATLWPSVAQANFFGSSGRQELPLAG
jgi:hypothetical protein